MSDMRAEIREQPAVAARLVDRGWPAVERVAEAVRDGGVDHVLIAARGTSDHAAVYAQYVLGTRHRLPVALAAPSVVSLYGVAPRLSRTLVVGISQSGASPDVVAVLDAARDGGAPTVAVTNATDSPLARAATHVVDISAGPERAVAATKTYTAELVAIAMLSVAIGGDDSATPGTAGDRAALEAIPAALERALEAEADAERVARAQAGVDRCLVIGRGYEYATVREWALKLKELAHVFADPYSAADFRHGPFALVEAGIPVLGVATSGPTSAALADLLGRLRDEYGAEVVVASDDPAVRARGTWSLSIPGGVPEWLRPIVSIVPGQLHAYHLTRAKGLDPEAPRNIRKVTRTT